MKRILIVEDDAVLTSIYLQAYKAAGYDVATTADGEAGLERIQSFQPDVLQVDLLIPKINGVELIKRVRLLPEFKQLPIVVLSSCFHELTVKQARAAGANLVISKLNSSPKLLLEKIEGLLSPASPETNPNDFRKEFLERLPRFQTDMRLQLQAFIKAQQNDPERTGALQWLHQTVRSLAGQAGMIGLVAAFQFAGALEVLLSDLVENPQHLTASVIRTIANAVDCLLRILKNSATQPEPYPMASLILSVDDDPISQKLISKALERVDLKALQVGSASLALGVLETNAFDLIFLDVDLSGEMDGFALCKKLRSFPLHQKTPVVFVTSASGFESKARSVLSGGNDLIGKPFPMLELGVKALTYIANAKIGG